MGSLNLPPFKIKMVEKIALPPREKREENLRRAHFNVFQIPAEDVFIDLLTDSGTSAMSDVQWSGLLQGDESYAGAKSFYRFEKVVQSLTGHRHIIPTHQGRGAESIFFSSIIKNKEMVIPNNTHFDTTRANIEQLGAKAIDLPCPEASNLGTPYPFKGNMDLEALERTIRDVGRERIPLVMMTITNNASGGQPASLENMTAVKKILDTHGIPLFLDACRFAENCYFIQQREEGQRERPLRDIVLDVFNLADGTTMSAKKDALVNIGGFITLKESGPLLEPISRRLILQEGFLNYGGLAGRDLEAMALGLEEVVEEDYLAYRTGQVKLLGEILQERGISIIRPTGGHAIYVDAAHFLPHIPKERFPGQALVVALYRHFGIRGVELGSVMFPDAPRELVRLAIPRRVYTNDQVRFVGESLGELYQKAPTIGGVTITEEPPFLRHFTAKFKEIHESRDR